MTALALSARFTGKIAMVTGAASGIGRAVALRLSRDGAAVIAASSCSQRAISLARAPRICTRARLRYVVEADLPPSTLRVSVDLVRK